MGQLPTLVNDQTPDRDDRTSERPPEDRNAGRRAIWSRRLAVAILVTFAAFLIFNASIVLILLLRSAAGGGGGPFGN